MSSSRRLGPRIIGANEPPVDFDRHDSGDSGDDPDLARTLATFISIVRRRWIVVFGLWFCAFVPTVLYAITSVPTYTSRGAVQVSNGGGLMGSNPLMEMMGAGSQAELQTEVEIIKRREFLVDVLMGLKLQLVDPNQPSLATSELGVTLGGASPVSPNLRAVRDAVGEAHVRPSQFAPIPLVLLGEADGRLLLDIGDEPAERVEFRVGERLDHERLVLEFNEAPVAPGESIELLLLPEGELLEEFSDRIVVSGLGNVRDPTNIVQISVTDTDRATAQAIVQSIMDRYLAKNLEWQAKSVSQAGEFIEVQLEEIRTSLVDAEDDLKDFAKERGAVQLDTQARVAIENSALLEAQRVSIELQERTITAVLSRLRGGKNTKASVTSNFFDDPVLAASVQALTEAETEYEILRASLTPEHPTVLQLGRALEFQKAEVTRLLRSARSNLSHQKEQLETELTKTSESMSHYPETQLELARLTREAKVSENLYTLLLEKYEETEIMKASTTTDKRIVDAASLPHKKTSPARGRLLAMGLFGGLLLGVGAALGTHFVQSRLDTVEAVRELCAFPGYGTIPLINGVAGEGQRLSVGEVWKNPHDAAAEAFRALGVAVSLLPVDGEAGRLIMTTSSQPSEGKSTVASNLAVALARSGKRVLILDLDLRKPVQHRVWGLARAPGYSDLVGQGAGSGLDLSTVAHLDAAGTGATVLTAGTRLPDTVAAIMAPTLAGLLERWRKDYEFVIIDSPPAFVAETTALARYADLVMLVARPGVIERPNLLQAIEVLGRADVALGLVLNGVGRQHTDYYGASYYYGATYGEDESKKPGDSGPFEKTG